MPGHELAGVAQQLVEAAGGDGLVEAALLHRRAQDVAAVPARDEVAALEADDPVEQAGAVRVAQAQDLALDRPQRDPRQAADGATPRTRRDDDAVRRDELSPATSTPVILAPSQWIRSTAFPVHNSTPTRRAASARAVTVARGSVAWSPGTASASRIVGASAGSSLRATLATSRSTPRLSSRRSSSSRSSACASSRSRATTSAPHSRSPGSIPPDACASSAANAGQASALRSPSSSSASSPGSASVTGASMPAATCDAPHPSSLRSNTRTACPRCAARQATASPITPPPMTTTPGVADGSCGIAPRFAGMIRISC